MNFQTKMLSVNDLPYFKKMILANAAAVIGKPQAEGLAVYTSEGIPVGCLIIWREDHIGYLRNIYILPKYRRQGAGTLLYKYWEQHYATNKLWCLKCFATLPESEQNALNQFFKKVGFTVQRFCGEVFTFNPYIIIKSKFIQKTLQRKEAFIPKSWKVVRYSELTEGEKIILKKSKGTIFPDYFAYDLDLQTLDMQHSFAFFHNDVVVGYITQRRITSYCVKVCSYAANPEYRGAGLIILKYYMFSLHFETPEIYQIRCLFTQQTEIAKKLFVYYTENKYSRHAISYEYTKDFHYLD